MPFAWRFWLEAVAIGVIVAATSGCGRTVRSCVPPDIARSREWIDLTAPENSRVALRPPNGQLPRIDAPDFNNSPRQILALSGGGIHGAFTAGVLNGWSDTGNRPTFDVVTGVSVGALIATYAFLGPDYDAELKRLFTTVSDRDIYRRRGPLAPLRSDSIASSEPLRRLIEAQITDDVLARVADAHARGLRLYVGTTNLDTRRFVVWDMGAIASRGELKLYRDIILASASVPGLFPPVRIDVEINGKSYSEMHGDGGVTAQVFVQRSMFGGDTTLAPARGKCSNSTVWVITAGKLYADASCTGDRTLEIGVNAINALLYSQTRNDIRRIAALAYESKAEFRLTALPQNFPLDPATRQFDPETMGKLFDVGHAIGRSGRKGWKDAPPPPDDVEQTPPRTGTQFAAPELVRPAYPPR